jgi:hypothetical protein
MFSLRFYRGDTGYQKEKNERILGLLGEIKKRYGIEYEIFDLRVTKDGYIDETHVREIYEKHFKPRAKVLKQKIGESLPRTLRSRRGRGHYYISGVIASLENGQIEWYTCYESCKKFKDIDEDYTIGFLKALLNQGIALLKEICPDINTLKSPHDFLIDEFIKINPLGGTIQREMKVGSMIFTNKYGSVFDWRKSIDLVVYTEQKKKIWIIEVKPKLNWEAFGQIIAYEHLFKKENPPLYVQKSIVCNESDSEILAICEEFDIKVFVWQEGEFKLASIKEGS